MQLLHRKESVVLTAIEIIDDLGFLGFSTKEIAKRQGISEGTLFKHFRSKNEIILAVLDHYSKFDLDIFESTMEFRTRNKSATEMVRFWVDAYGTYCENYPAITALAQLYDVLSYDAVLWERVQEIYKKRFLYAKKIVESIQETGEFSSDIDSAVLAEILTGSFRVICLTWRMDGRKYSLREKLLSSFNAIIDVLKKK